MTTISAVASTPSTVSVTTPTAAPVPTPEPGGTVPSPAYPPEYYDLLVRRGELEIEIQSLENDQWRKIGSANVSMTLAEMFRLQEEREAEDAIANGETPVKSVISGVMSSSGRATLRSAGETAQLTNERRQELASVKAQIAEIEARVNPAATASV
jgi:hypothetical protein